MASQFRLLFEGLCAFKDRASWSEAYLIAGHGHGANLVMPTDVLDLPAVTWLPSRIATIYDGGKPRQIGIWDLFGEEMKVVANAGSGKPAWVSKNALIDFSIENTNSKTLDRKDIQTANKDVGVIELQGKSEIEPIGNKGKFELFKSGLSHKVAEFMTLVEWRPPADDYPAIANKAGKVIVLDGKSPAPWGCISNAAPVDGTEGLKHFPMYYIGMTLETGDKSMTIERKFTNIFDCVPPTAWP